MIRLTIQGEPCSMKNSRRIVKNARTGKPMSIKSRDAVSYADHVKAQAIIATRGRYQPVFTDEKVSFTATLYYATDRKDLDGELLIDALQGVIYKNDKQVREKHLIHKIDRVNPRAEIEVRPL